MQQPHSPSIRRRRLSARLRSYREATGKTTGQVASDLGWQQTKVSRIETGMKKTVQPDELDALLDFYDEKSPDVRAELHECARMAKQRGWWSRYRNVLVEALPDFETEASVIRAYECQVVPGLLQTAEYAEAIFRANLVRSDEEIQERVAARLKRQEILNRVDPPTCWVILDEAALRRTIGSRDVMRVQLRHLTHMAARHNVNIYVLPYSAGAHPATVGSFVIMDFPNPLETSIGYVETPTSSVYAEEADEVAELNSIFGGAQGSSLSPAQSLEFITDIIKTLEE
ncbi:helix-turn-helix domain-containing protein [Streptomonospora wellingtoniae]|uniref:Helix-turn-helix transcriptional regulator n=1 Tax=Streptomonospora wellingtoniae TaxID=3075544 RepID=A0ABU2L0C1_9ACTN|nr:helix-turn-helix transcriptional regulator [Streptomonospora sp. DSM 45055]MDT0305001.1 helix-turn-helix transcriptional regulator [Streptomonospora sp. DSM 45055]